MLASSVYRHDYIHFSEFKKGTANNWIIRVLRIESTFPD